MIQSLKLGTTTFPVNIIQGPLAGISCAPFRRLIWDYSQPAFTCTEMMSCKTLIHQPQSKQRFTKIDPQEGPVCFQLSGNDPKELAEATKIVTDYGADLIDLNCGCPVNKIRSRGAGSRLLMHPSRLFELITSMKRNTHLPVSIKIRVDGNSSDQCNSDIAQVVSDAGADFLIVHGRHWTEQYETPCHHDQIQFFVEKLHIPVIGNGDIADLDSLKKMVATGCAGVMIGRAGVGQPWLINQLIAEMKQAEFTIPTNKVIGSLFMRHVLGLAELLHSEKFAVIQARKFAKYYARTLMQRADFCQEINSCEDLRALEKSCDRYFS